MPANNHATYNADDDVILALFECNGNVIKTAKKLGLKNVWELRDRINKNPLLKRAKQEALEQVLDKAEAVVTTKMTKTDARWLLERKGKARGYGNSLTTTNLNLNANIQYDFTKIPLEERLKLLETIQNVIVTE